MSPKAKNWTIGVLCFFLGVVMTVIGFFALTIYVSFIRENDEPQPRPLDVNVVDTCVVDSELVE